MTYVNFFGRGQRLFSRLSSPLDLEQARAETMKQMNAHCCFMIQESRSKSRFRYRSGTVVDGHSFLIYLSSFQSPAICPHKTHALY